jgi:hypothetical protein
MSIDATKRRELEIQLLAMYKSERGTLDQKIILLEQSLGLDGEHTPAPIQAAHASNGSQPSLSSMTRAQAAIEVLKKERRVVTNKELGKLLEQGGVDMSSVNALVTLNTALSRSSQVRKLKTPAGIAWELIGSNQSAKTSNRSQHKGRRGSKITLGNVAENAIRKAGRPLHVKEIREALIEHGLNPSRGTLSAGLMRDSKGRFKNIGSATYTLAKEDLKPAQTS